ncbi:histidine phosphatase family protein [Rhizohabitans arisaemae]|uniref:histidine phosphatase family protein n=1 Tax=Rhizohabitans arisaemae TaxID=2720610 RepID=UPI0024B14D3F|nr:histidine phosphatase family protein [Rhizohabitans arisaemae]
MNTLILIRHGETEWSRTGRHTGRTDVALTARGERQARDLRRVLSGCDPALTLVSPALRARRTAELAGLPRREPDRNLWEWDYGGYEGMTTQAIRQARPGWFLWRDGVPSGATPGETAQEVGLRADAVLARVRPALGVGDVVLVAHGHLLRVLVARWLGLAADRGRLFRLDTATVSTLGWEHAEPVVNSLNLPA